MCDERNKSTSDVSSRVIGTYLVSVKYSDLDTLTSAPENGDTFLTSDKWYEPFPSVRVDAINAPDSNVRSATVAPATGSPAAVTTPDRA
jgi:hypothetical protein